MSVLAVTSTRFARHQLVVSSYGSSLDSRRLADLLVEAANHLSWPTRNTRTPRAVVLEQLAERWIAEARFVSSLSDMVAHPAYQRIIGMGRDALPFLLRQLETGPQHWFPALEAITGINPVRAEDNGRVQRMAQAWVAWGREQGHI